ncbi:MAG: hypothetical protein ABJC04_06855 [Verrucomicrobiota bacterium]
MKFFYLLGLIAIMGAAVLTGCKSNSGSREFIPGKGWVPTN